MARGKVEQCPYVGFETLALGDLRAGFDKTAVHHERASLTEQPCTVGLVRVRGASRERDRQGDESRGYA
jgi:hypothetical protein